MRISASFGFIMNYTQAATDWKRDISVRLIKGHEEIPYDLLLDADPSMEVVLTYLGESEVYIALLKNQIIGTFVLYPVDPETLEIKNIAVRESFQGKGVGTLLLERAANIAALKGAAKMIIATSNASIGPLYLYQKAGFNMESLKKDYIIENYPEPLFDNGIECRHMIVLSKHLKKSFYVEDKIFSYAILVLYFK
jgi:ribosomal protein S18 acetylase RimI-like enzyme